ncbi:MAG TPA: hypothetical protein VN887_12840, partial [Candidatus Angelobacter sp.]|nr:hypothetical protein [Candidatus Angelobacter sp.]
MKKSLPSILRRWLPILLIVLGFACHASAQTTTNSATTGFGPVQISLGGHGGPQDVDTGIKLLLVLTLLSLAPSILLLMTCFT